MLLSGAGTAAVESCISSLVSDDDTILIVVNGSYGERACHIANAYNLNYIAFNMEWTSAIDVQELRRVIENNKKITHIFFVHHETTTGLLNPFSDIISLCRRFNIATIVDAMSSFAGIPISLKTDPADFLISSSNKCIQGMAGIGFVIANKKLLTNSLKPRNYYLNLYNNYKYLEEYSQTMFTPPVQVFYALREALEEYFEEGEKSRYLRYVSLYNVLINGLKKIGMKLLIDESIHSKILTTVLEPDHPNYNFDELHDVMKQYDITIYPGKVKKYNSFRIANIGAITLHDMEFFIDKLDDYIDRYRIVLNDE